MTDSHVAVEVPQYRCHKIVRAAKITEIRESKLAGAVLILGEIRGQKQVDLAWQMKHKPEVGGYYMIYGDGYTSYSPATAFEEGYSKL